MRASGKEQVQGENQIQSHHYFRHFSNFDDFEEVAGGWALEFRQLDRGRLSADIQQFSAGKTVVTRVRFNRALDQVGCPPPGFLTFGIVDGGGPSVRWRGAEADELSLIAFDQGGFEFLTRPGHRGIVFSVPAEHLVRAAERLELRGDPEQIVQSATRISAEPRPEVAGIRTLARELCHAALCDPSRLTTDLFLEELEVEIPRRLLLAISSPTASARRNSINSRQRAFNKARDLIRDHRGAPLTVQQVCEHTGVSWRTLDYAFKEYLGMTPKAYLQALRLDEARRQLRLGSYSTVAACAQHCGFWHMGQFAADYRAQFGELPSATIRRA